MREKSKVTGRMKVYPKAWREGGKKKKNGRREGPRAGGRKEGRERKGERIIHFSVLYTLLLIKG